MDKPIFEIDGMRLSNPAKDKLLADACEELDRTNNLSVASVTSYMNVRGVATTTQYVKDYLRKMCEQDKMLCMSFAGFSTNPTKQLKERYWFIKPKTKDK